MNIQFFKFILLAIAVLYISETIHAQSVPPVKVEDCPAVKGAINIDGSDTEASWSEVQGFTIFSLSDPGDWEGEADLSAEMKFTWDNEYFYVFVDIRDDIEHNWNGVDGNWYEFDNINIYFQLDTMTVPSDYTDNTVWLFFNRGDAGWSYPGRANPEDFIYFWGNTADGWLLEAAIPWTCALPEGSVPEDIMGYLPLIGFDVLISDSDGSDPIVGERNSGTQMAWDEDGDEGQTADGTEDLAWNNTAVFGYLELVGSPSVNPAPIADAGPDQTVDENSLVELNATGSYDPEGESITQYQWTAPAGIELSDLTSATPTFTAPEVHWNKEYTFSLIVTDESEVTSTDKVTITVINTNDPLIADAGPDQTVNEREIVLLQGSSNDPAKDDSLTFSWSSPENVRFVPNGSSSAIMVAPDVSQNTTYRFVLMANDGQLDSEPDTMNLYVKALKNEYDTVFVYDTVYIMQPAFNTIMISVVDDGKLIAEEREGELFVELFPNPADQFINIRSEMIIYEIEIIDIQANVVLHETVNALTAEFNLAGFSAGNYFIRIYTKSGLVIKQLVLE